MTDMKSFRLGENIATTHGRVIYENDLMPHLQLRALHTPRAAAAAAHRAALDQQVLCARPAAEKLIHRVVR
jgi:hypothetical protein